MAGVVPPRGARRRQPPGASPGVRALCWHRPHVCAPPTSRGAVARAAAMPAGRRGPPRRPRHSALPSCRPLPRRGGTRVSPWAALDRGPLLEEHQAQDRAAPWDGAPQGARVGVGGARRPSLGPGVLALGGWERRQPLGPWTHQRPLAAEEVARGAPLRRRPVGLWEPAPAEAHGHVLRREAVVCGVAARAGVPVEGLPEDAGQTGMSTPVRQPSPRAAPGERDDPRITRWRPAREAGRGACRDVRRHEARPRLVEEATSQRSGVEIEPTGCVMLGRGASQEVSSASCGCEPRTRRPTAVGRGGGLHKSQWHGADTAPRRR
jgi:hypothetical protein